MESELNRNIPVFLHLSDTAAIMDIVNQTLIFSCNKLAAVYITRLHIARVA